jgi:hypothetical protein
MSNRFLKTIKCRCWGRQNLAKRVFFQLLPRPNHQQSPKRNGSRGKSVCPALICWSLKDRAIYGIREFMHQSLWSLVNPSFLTWAGKRYGSRFSCFLLCLLFMRLGSYTETSNLKISGHLNWLYYSISPHSNLHSFRKVFLICSLPL